MRKLAPLGAVSITLVLAVNFQAAPSGNIHVEQNGKEVFDESAGATLPF
jgi:hypothetical protein